MFTCYISHCSAGLSGQRCAFFLRADKAAETATMAIFGGRLLFHQG